MGTVLPERAFAATGSPIGAFDSVSIRFNDRWVVSGWASDADIIGKRVQVRLYLGSTFVTQIPTGDERPDIGAAVPGVGPGTGWHATVDESTLATLGMGKPLCAYAINVGGGANSFIGCQTLPTSGPEPRNPKGALDSATTSPGHVELIGWAGDPDGDRTTLYRVYSDGVFVMQRTAALHRLDVFDAFPSIGGTVGFDLVLPQTPGTHQVCVYAQNTGLKGLENLTVGCATRTVPS